jgi:hypothetical protein
LVSHACSHMFTCNQPYSLALPHMRFIRTTLIFPRSEQYCYDEKLLAYQCGDYPSVIVMLP